MPEDTGTVNDAQEAPTEGDPQVEAPAAESTDSQTQQTDDGTDYRQRYENLRPQYDRTMAQVQQYEQVFQDPATLARAIKATGLSENELLAALGYETEGTPEEDLSADPLEGDVQQIKEWVSQQQQAAEAAQLEELEAQFFDQEITALEKAENRQFSEEELHAIVALAEQMPDEQGLPQVGEAFKRIQAIADSANKRYVESKKAPAIAIGQPGSEAIDLSDENKRIDVAAQIAQAAMDADK